MPQPINHFLQEVAQLVDNFPTYKTADVFKIAHDLEKRLGDPVLFKRWSEEYPIIRDALQNDVGTSLKQRMSTFTSEFPEFPILGKLQKALNDKIAPPVGAEAAGLHSAPVVVSDQPSIPEKVVTTPWKTLEYIEDFTEVPYTAQGLDEMCETDAPLRLIPGCHSLSGVLAVYEAGVLKLVCRECNEFVLNIQVAKGGTDDTPRAAVPEPTPQ